MFLSFTSQQRHQNLPQSSSMHIEKFDLILKSNSCIHSRREQDLNPFSFVVNFSVFKRHAYFLLPSQPYPRLRKYRSFSNLPYRSGFLDFCSLLLSLELTLIITPLMKYTHKPSNQLPRCFLKVNTQLKMQSTSNSI